MRGKRGFIRIIEAFVAILLIAGVVIFVLNRGLIGGGDLSARVYEDQVSILREIETDDELRNEILSVSESELPLKWEDFSQHGLTKTRAKILERTPEYLNCIAKVCALNDICGMDVFIEEDVYAQAVAVTATLQNFDPRQIKLFCWTN